MRVRTLSPTERLYLACEDFFPPFAIQFLLALEQLPTVAELEDALNKVAHANPSIRFEVEGRWWVDAKRIPQVRIYECHDGTPIEAPLLKEKITSTGPSCEIVVWNNRGLLFRASHVLMDAGGLLFWVEEMCRALRGEVLLGSSFAQSDNDFLKSLKHPAPREPFRFNYPSAYAATQDVGEGFSWSHQTMSGQYSAYVAKLAQKIAAAGSDKSHHSRFMIPVDLRRIFPAIHTTMNFSNPLFLALHGTEEWEQIYQVILEGITSKSYQAIDWKDRWIMLLPRGVLKRVVKYLHIRSVKKNYFALTGVLSHVGTVSLARFAVKNFIPRAAYFMPLDIPCSAMTVVSVQHDHALEVTQSLANKSSGQEDHSSRDWLCFHGEKKIWETEKENIYELVAEQAKNHPELIAATHLDERWCYRVLIEKATLVHASLAELKLGPGDVVAIFFNRSLKVLATVLGVLRSGAAFVPIDTAWPLNRQQFILEDANATALITDIENMHQVAHPNKIIWEHLLLNANSPVPVMGELAYILYTSGSTGLPKGIKVGHASLRNYVLWARDAYQQNNEEALCFPFFTSLVFDLTLTSIFLPWLTKGQVKIISNKSLVEQVSEVLQDDKINSIKLTPSHLGVFNELGFARSGIQRLIIGGEALGTSLVSTTLHQKSSMRIFNEYGPTEATVGCMVHLFDPVQDKEDWVPIGKPIANCTILLKSTGSATSSQEMYLTGDCLAMGYLGIAAKEQKSFLSHPYKPNERVYRSGDFASVNHRGELVYQGRLDDQLKIRGYRMELGEIEGCIHASELTNACAVIVCDPVKKRLIAYVVWKDEVALNDLWSFLRAKLPVYMIPEQIITISKLPLTINGKVDKHVLATHFNETLAPYKTNLNNSVYTNELVSLLAEVLEEKHIKIDSHHSLLEQGVDSLSMSIFLTRILNRYFEGKTNFELFFSNTDFIQNPTLELLDRIITKEAS